MTSFATRLKRIRSSPFSPKETVLVRDPRLPISKNARKTWEYLGDLTSRGARLVRPSVEALAALKALRALISEAQSGDLAHNGDAVPAQTVEEWLSSRLPHALEELVQEVTAGSKDHDVALREELIELIGQYLLLPLGDAAKHIRVEEAALLDTIRRSPQSIGYLAGPPALLFQLVSEGNL